ncbi:hypothetical protein Q1M63_10425 (plasmid) [Sinorhizobium meliloti]|nr:hypothetical protein Q1M63_10425 [Sinorhizobium meliloti]
MAFELPPPTAATSCISCEPGRVAPSPKLGGEGSFSYRRSCRAFGGIDVSMTYQSHLRISRE